ncbi:MAG: IscS subfamily cysteine desulfurase [Gammaproteobacteria bacterium]|nr:IscS subfamily cysteine desulfurase [Gammaproteobacteria bacterium]
MPRHRPIYLDYAATTPVDPRVAEKMAGCLTADGVFGNPASRSHALGWEAERAVEKARQQVADLLGAEPREIVFTSGATESDNLALLGAAHAACGRGRHVVTASTEHKAVLDSCRQLEREGWEVTYLAPDRNGLLDPDAVAAELRDETALVSIMHVNNETGVIQDIAAIGARVRAHGALFHVDAAQSAGRLAIDLRLLPVDLMAFSAHKLYGPKGVGALYVRDHPAVRLEPLLHGGGQERGLRPGTLATHQVVGMGEAFRLAGGVLAEEAERLRALRDRLWEGLHELGGVRLNGDPVRRVPNILSVRIDGVQGEALIMALRDVALSSGAACASASREPSHVLRALGLGEAEVDSSLRFSLGRFTTSGEIDAVLELAARTVPRLRSLARGPHGTDSAGGGPSAQKAAG